MRTRCSPVLGDAKKTTRTRTRFWCGRALIDSTIWRTETPPPNQMNVTQKPSMEVCSSLPFWLCKENKRPKICGMMSRDCGFKFKTKFRHSQRKQIQVSVGTASGFDLLHVHSVAICPFEMFRNRNSLCRPTWNSPIFSKALCTCFSHTCLKSRQIKWYFPCYFLVAAVDFGHKRATKTVDVYSVLILLSLLLFTFSFGNLASCIAEQFFFFTDSQTKQIFFSVKHFQELKKLERVNPYIFLFFFFCCAFVGLNSKELATRVSTRGGLRGWGLKSCSFAHAPWRVWLRS